jgi:hypothetical protein
MNAQMRVTFISNICIKFQYITLSFSHIRSSHDHQAGIVEDTDFKISIML